MAYVDLEDIYEPFIAEIKTELEATGLFEDINEGETIYEGEGTVAWVIPSETSIRHTGMAQVTHEMTLYVIVLTTSMDATMPELRQVAQQAYDKLMEDITHNGTCWKCIPAMFHPGYMAIGEQIYMGVLTQWQATMHQAYVIP